MKRPSHPRSSAQPSLRAGCARYVTLLLVAFILGVSPARAQKASLFEHLNVKNGLSQGTVHTILQDSRGFMWFGTEDGLNRYDGYDIRVFKSVEDDSTTLTDNWIEFLGEDTAGVLWVGTRNAPGVLHRFDRAAESFVRVPRDSVRTEFARESHLFPEVREASGVRWFGLGSDGGGLRRLDPRTGDTTRYLHDPADPNSLGHDEVYSVVRDRIGALWLGTRGGLDRFDEKTGIFTHYRNDPADPRSISDNYAWPILEDRDGILWVGTYQGGLNRFDPAAGTFTRIRHDESDPRSLAGDRLFALAQDASGMIWVGTGDLGVDRFHPGLSNFEHILHDPSDPGSLSSNNILSMYVDRGGTLWVGTRDGLNRWDRRNGKFRVYRHNPADPASIADDQVQVMLEDRSGNLWIGTPSRGLDRFDRKSGTFFHYRNDKNNPRSLPDDRVYALLEDRSGTLWVGTYKGGLARLDRATDTFESFRFDPSDTNGIAVPGVWALLEDRAGRLWVGTLGGGLDRFDRQTKKFIHHRAGAGGDGTLSDNVVVTLLEDRAGRIWVGTVSGLNMYDPAADAFRTYRIRDGLPNELIIGLLEDVSGKIWISTVNGLSRFDPDSGTFRNYDYLDGLQGNEFNQSAYAKDPRTGEMFFGGSNGFNAFRPDRITSNRYVPPIVFSDFTRYNSDDEEGKPIREPGIDTKTRITLSYKDNVTNFEFAALNYFNSYKNQYAYWLEGYTENWIQLGGERRATFTNLDGGDYVLHVKGSNNEGVWNETGATLNITVTPPWWKTRWAYGSYLVLIVAVLYGLRREEINRREQKMRIREAQLQAKAAEAEKRALQAENERQTKELEDARLLQLSMLPKKIPEVPGYEIAVFMKTATEVGGDYYDFNLAPDGELNVAFGDATGHGMQAGTIVTLMKGLFISESSKFEIQKFFNHCSRAIKEIKLGRLYMALTLVRFKGKNVSLSSAGMPPAYLHRKADGSIEEILLKAVPLGAMKSFPYSLYETAMEDGDTLLLITDGLPEQKNAAADMFDYARIIDCFRGGIPETPEEIIRRLVAEGETWMEGVVQEDDITLMVVRKTAGNGLAAAA